ncbi:MAG: baeRF10 domain-containing protein [Bellilinea sp.]
MLNENELRELARFIVPDPVVSLYLNTDSTAATKDAYRLRLRNLLKEVEHPLDVAVIQNYFQADYDWSGRGVAVFSCAPQKFFRAYPLALPLPDLIHISDRPSLGVLTRLLDSFGGYGVILVDKQGARAFSFHLGVLQEQEGVLGEVVKQVKRGGASTVVGGRSMFAGVSRHVEEVIERNMKESAAFAVRFFEDAHIRRILIGGTDDNIALFRGLLPKAFQSLVVGTFPMSMSANQSEVLAKAMQIGQEADEKRENTMVSDLIAQSARGADAVIGLDNTLDAANADRINTLVVLQGYQQPAYRCKNCSYLTPRPHRTCANCGGEMYQIPDVIDVAVSRTLRKGGNVEVIRAHPQLDKAGKLGAFLRF